MTKDQVVSILAEAHAAGTKGLTVELRQKLRDVAAYADRRFCETRDHNWVDVARNCRRAANAFQTKPAPTLSTK